MNNQSMGDGEGAEDNSSFIMNCPFTPSFDEKASPTSRSLCKRLASQKNWKVSVIHASCRNIEAVNAYDKWMSLAQCPKDIEYIMALDKTQEAMRIVERPLFEPTAIILLPYKLGSANKCNEAAKLTTGDIIIQASDDVVPPLGWDSLLKEAADWSKEVVLDINEGVEDSTPHDCHHVKGIIMSRARYMHQGYWMHPDIHHLFGDDWLSFCAERDGVIVSAKHLVFEHFHYAYGKRERDEHDRACKCREEKAYGKAVYERLKKEYFERGKMF